MREIEWTEPALGDLAALDKGIARRIVQAVERFAKTGAGIPFACCAFAIGARLTGRAASH